MSSKSSKSDCIINYLNFEEHHRNCGKCQSQKLNKIRKIFCTVKVDHEVKRKLTSISSTMLKGKALKFTKKNPSLSREQHSLSFCWPLASSHDQMSATLMEAPMATATNLEVHHSTFPPNICHHRRMSQLKNTFPHPSLRQVTIFSSVLYAIIY